MSLPYPWIPFGAEPRTKPDEGDIVALEHQVYVISDRLDRRDQPDHQDDELPLHYRLRPIEVQDWELHARDTEIRKHVTDNHIWYVYPTEHYPICASCSEPMPCRHNSVEAKAQRQLEELARYDDKNLCPSCLLPVLNHSHTMTWNENIVVPLGEPVTFHLTGYCIEDAREYERRWAAHDPDNRSTTLSCLGEAHYDKNGGFSCSNGPNCVGRHVDHPRHDGTKPLGQPRALRGKPISNRNDD